MSINDFTIGADPEFFVAKSGKAVPAYDAIPGTKAEPHKVNEGAVQVDGLALEVNIDPVSFGNYDGDSLFDQRIIRVVKTAKTMAEGKLGRLAVLKESYTEFDKDVLDSLPEEAKELGCDPDWNAYTLAHNERPDGDVPFRVVGGHIHVGWASNQPVEDPDYIKMCADFVKVLDLFVGIPLKIADTEERRRQMYGKAGAFRPKPYGVEYRSPSNFWIMSSTRRKAVYEMTRVGVQQMIMYQGSAEKVVLRFSRKTPEEIAEIINDPSPETVKEAVRIYDSYLKYNSSYMDAVVSAGKSQRSKA